MKVLEYIVNPSERLPRSVTHAIHYGSAGANLCLYGQITKPAYEQSYLRISLISPSAVEDNIYQPAESASVHLNISQVAELIADLQEQYARMLPVEKK